MTIRVCREKTNKIFDKFCTGIKFSVRLAMAPAFFYGLYLTGTSWTVGGALGFGDFMLGTVLLAGSSLMFLHQAILSPGLWDEPNWFTLLNRKFKLFEWRNDC